jgi:hypothetical protein
MTTYSRAGFKWSVNEVLSLQREFELLGLSIYQIAAKHKRSPNAIMHKLDQEGFADYNVLYSNFHDLNSSMQTASSECCDEECDEDECDEDECDNDNDDDYTDEDYMQDCAKEEDIEEDDDEDDEEDCKVNKLSQRVEVMEDMLSEIRDTVRAMQKMMTSSSQCASDWL